MDIQKLYKKREINYFENIEFEFSRNFVKYIKTYNQLDSNIGYTISILVGTPYPQLTYPLIGKLTTQEKMRVLKKIVKERFTESNPEMIHDYDNWIDKASKTRTERNQYIHGYWHLSGSLDEKPIYFSPLNWEIKKSGDADQKFSLEEYKSIVDELENISIEFGNSTYEISILVDLSFKYLANHRLHSDPANCVGPVSRNVRLWGKRKNTSFNSNICLYVPSKVFFTKYES